jgi:hypothetical protein
MHRYLGYQSDDPETAELHAGQPKDQCRPSYDRYAAVWLLQRIQPVFSCNNTCQVASQRHPLWRHFRLRCSHRVGMYYVVSRTPNLRTPPADTIPGKGPLHYIVILQPNWKDFLLVCRLRYRRRSSHQRIDKTLSALKRIAGPKVHAPVLSRSK